MSDYGVKSSGFIRKKQDVIKAELAEDISEELGIDVGQNPQSLLNVILTTFSNRIAQLWEVAEDVYFSQYVSTAEGANLDFAAEAGGLSRNVDTRTKYKVLCTGTDGTVIPSGTRLASTTNPKVYMTRFGNIPLSRTQAHKIRVKVASVENSTPYTVTVGFTAYTITSGATATASAIISALATEITDTSLTVTADDETLIIECTNPVVSNAFALSDNLTTEDVSCIIVFQTEQYGAVVLPTGVVTEIATPVLGLDSVTNLANPILGSLKQTDDEYRHSYLKRIASRSTMMLDSISSSILQNVAGVVNCTAYENATNSTDADGRPPHSIEVVAQGGADMDIAEEILKRKPVGIQTYGSVSVDVPDLFDSTINVKFNRPTNIYTWIKVEITEDSRTPLPTNYAELIKDAIMGQVEGITAGEAILGQGFLSAMNEACSGIAYADIYIYGTANGSYTPVAGDFTDHNLFPTSRQLAVCDPDRIEVVVND